MKNIAKITNEVKNLIQKNNDAHKGFIKAAADVQSDLIKSYLIDQAEQRKEFAQELAEKLKHFNPEAKVNMEGSTMASLHRNWIDLKSTFTGMDDAAVLAECIRGDKASLEEYKEFLDDYADPSQEIGKIVRRQFENITTTLDGISRLEALE